MNKKLLILFFFFLFVACKNNRSGHYSNYSNHDSNVNTNSESKNSPTKFDTNLIEISHYCDSLVDSTFSKYRLTELDKKTLKQILSDPNPDPEDKADQVCGTKSKKCNWCGKIFQVETKYITFKSTLNLFINPVVQIGMIFSTLFGLDGGVGDQLHVICVKFRKGIRYDCVNDFSASNFCSQKCERESRN